MFLKAGLSFGLTKPTQIDPTGGGSTVDGPTAVCSLPDPAVVGSSAMVDCSASYPASDGSPISFSWSIASKPACSNLSIDSLYPRVGVIAGKTSFSPDCAGTYSVFVTVSDSLGRSAMRNSTISAVNGPIRIVPSPAVYPGQTISIPVIIHAGAQLLCSAQLGVSFPSNIFTLSSTSMNNQISHLVRTTISGVIIDAASTTNLTLQGDVTLFTLTFTIASGVGSGFYEIKLSPSFLLPEGRTFVSPEVTDCGGVLVGNPPANEMINPYPKAEIFVLPPPNGGGSSGGGNVKPTQR